MDRMGRKKRYLGRVGGIGDGRLGRIVGSGYIDYNIHINKIME